MQVLSKPLMRARFEEAGDELFTLSQSPEAQAWSSAEVPRVEEQGMFIVGSARNLEVLSSPSQNRFSENPVETKMRSRPNQAAFSLSLPNS